MGQTLSEPETSKESAFCQNDYYKVGSSCMQGWRIHMEDSHTHILSLPDDPGTAFFAVYDGHGGANIAQYAGGAFSPERSRVLQHYRPRTRGPSVNRRVWIGVAWQEAKGPHKTSESRCQPSSCRMEAN